ncbi:MAG: hypothetical protein MUF81_16960 [Verrucomicrobia bacterium]|nr:hypothetical protein [Verrucomicrobiota bacterium]
MNDSASSCSSDSSVPHLIVFHVAIKRTGSDKNCLNRWITLFFLAGVLFLSATAFGQSSPFDPGYSALVEKVRKNEAAEAEAKKREAAKPKPMEIRIVEGKAYNINASTNWE